MGRALRPGEEVSWNTSQGVTHGKVIGKTEHAGHIKGHKVAALPDNPEYIVESAKSGKRAAHKRGALKKS
jgi:Hypervirulence associated proteins TUDOR domain